MEFLTTSPVQPPKNLFPCLATVTLSPINESARTRRLSTSSIGNNDNDDGNALRRVLSGGRRKSSFGQTTGAHPQAGSEDGDINGKWYWRVQVGVTDNHLVLLPLTYPPNSLLTSRPAPLSADMPSHSTTNPSTAAAAAEGDEGSGIGSKIKNLFRRSSTQDMSQPQAPHKASESAAHPPAVPEGGEQPLPLSEGNAESKWPGVIQGTKLGAVLVSLGGVDKAKVTMGGGKKGEGSWVLVPIASHFTNMAHPMMESVGKHSHESLPRTGSVRFDFDKDWIGGKAEAELLHHYITTAMANLGGGGPRLPPQTTKLQLGTPYHFTALEQDAVFAPDEEVGVDESVSTQSGKVGEHV
ncbi:hypothetical protein P7C73_g613, partial [Tremellales sp. Uapishka_1]